MHRRNMRACAAAAGSAISRGAGMHRAFCEPLEERTLLSSAGLLDTTFGTNGQARIIAGNFQEFHARAMAVQSDGKIVEVGFMLDFSDGSGDITEWTLARLNVDGSLDKTFGADSFGGGNGYFFTNVSAGSNFSEATAVAIQPDGKIVVGGYVTFEGVIVPQVVRYNHDGSLDTSFGQSQTGVSDIFVATVSSIAIQKDGDILVAGTNPNLDNGNDGDFGVARLTPGGIEDLDFDNLANEIDLGGDEQLNAMAVDYNGSAQSNPNYGKIILAGSSDGEFALARLNTDGSLDNSFSGDGKLLTLFASGYDTSIAYGVAIQPNDKIVIVGQVGVGKSGNFNFGAMRFNSDGSIDSTFGVTVNGGTAIDFGQDDESARDVLIGQTGDLLIGGWSGTEGGALECLNSSGAVDPLFAGGGKELVPFSEGITSMALGSNGTFYTTEGDTHFDAERYFDRAVAVQIISNQPVASEAGQASATFQVTREQALPYATRVYYSVGGTATPPGPIPSGVDYTGIAAIGARFVDIPANQTVSAPVAITPVDDSVPEADETIIITLQENAGVYDVGQSSSVTLTILDNDRQISGFVFNDADSSGTFDTGETGLQGWTVFVDANHNNNLDAGEARSVTNGDGEYFLGNLGIGLEDVRAVIQSNYRQTFPLSPSSVELVEGSDVKDRDFGVTTNALISGTVFNDTNDNGVKDASESFEPGWTVYADLNEDGSLDNGEPSTHADINGAYSFNSLSAGSYRIAEVLQSDWVATAPLPNNFFDVTVGSGQTSANHAFGVSERSISGNVFNDLDHDGVKDPNESGLLGMDVWIDTNGNGQFDPFPVQQNLGLGVTIQLPADAFAVTDANGNYTIAGGLAATTYAVQLNLADGQAQTLPKNNAPRTVSLATNPVSTGNNFGVNQSQIKLVTTAITGSVFNDLNGNGVRDVENPTEPDNVGWVVWLDTDNDGQLDNGEVSQATDAGGNFEFDNLQAGVTYHVRSQLQSGWVATTPGEVDVTLSANQSVDEDFGVMQEATISGNVFNDANGNGSKDPGESGEVGVKVYIDSDLNGAPGSTEPFTMTDPSGNYSFTVPAGSYRIREVVPGGLRLDSPASGLFDATVDAGQTITGDNFANAPTTDPASVTLQGESAALAGGTVAGHANGGYTGSGYADFGGSGSSAQWTTTRVTAGAVALVFRYANGGTGNRPLSIVVNGVTIGSLTFVPTGSWTTWKTVSINANLKIGGNTIKGTATSSAGGANVDSLTINTAVAPVIYQAESATLAGGTVAAHTNSGYTGSGYADFGGKNSSATFTVTGTGSATTLTFRYANGTTANRPLSVTVNGKVVGSITFAPTGSWTSWATVTLSVNLLSGSNTIKLLVTGSDGPNLDWMSVGSG